jgi:hypothetical protein
MAELTDIVNDTPIDIVTEIPQIKKESIKYVLGRIFSNSNYGKEATDQVLKENFVLMDFIYKYFRSDASAGSALYMGLAIYGMLKLEAKLPKVTCEAVRQVLAEYKNQARREDYIFGVLSKIRKKDATLADFISNFSDAFDNPMPAFEGGLLIYRFMEKQAEMNRLKIN